MNINTHTFDWTIIYVPDYSGLNYIKYRVIYLAVGEGMIR